MLVSMPSGPFLMHVFQGCSWGLATPGSRGYQYVLAPSSELALFRKGCGGNYGEAAKAPDIRVYYPKLLESFTLLLNWEKTITVGTNKEIKSPVHV